MTFPSTWYQMPISMVTIKISISKNVFTSEILFSNTHFCKHHRLLFSSVCQVTPILLFMETSSPWTYHNLRFLSPISLLAGSASMVLLPVPPSTSFVFIWVEERHNQGISLVLPPKQLDIWGPYNPGQYVHFKFMAIFPTNHTDFYWPVFPLL